MTMVHEATGRHWCNFCPDLIVPGEWVLGGLASPVGGPGYAHVDCARRAGHDVPLDPPASVQAAVRRAIRDELHGDPE